MLFSSLPTPWEAGTVDALSLGLTSEFAYSWGAVPMGTAASHPPQPCMRVSFGAQELPQEECRQLGELGVWSPQGHLGRQMPLGAHSASISPGPL